MVNYVYFDIFFELFFNIVPRLAYQVIYLGSRSTLQRLLRCHSTQTSSGATSRWRLRSSPPPPFCAFFLNISDILFFRVAECTSPARKNV
ncbi:MAG: hypothetical protein COW02_01665 [Comamonadaceae bacterium CG12_big_fil_rev_8_21_14_0_65_59_15]|nr:MAG: hypothetical protein COW02_01665 [Comamonadaceae bacterium CG12_big_fil_rev_8_21_14_0_65_59_15]